MKMFENVCHKVSGPLQNKLKVYHFLFKTICYFVFIVLI